MVSDVFGNDPQVIESGSIFLKFLGTYAIVLAFIFFLLKNEKTIIIKKLLLGGGVLVLLQLINLFIYIQSIPIEILFSTILISTEKDAGAKNIYKIILGQFETREQANSYKKDLKKNKKILGFVVALGDE